MNFALKTGKDELLIEMFKLKQKNHQRWLEGFLCENCTLR